jgi:hypothetical protein
MTKENHPAKFSDLRYSFPDGTCADVIYISGSGNVVVKIRPRKFQVLDVEGFDICGQYFTSKKLAISAAND